jgi:hypothetical protein
MALDRRKVTMKSIGLAPDGTTLLHEAIDYVDLEHLDAYVEDAKTRWQSVTVGDKTDHGPGGKDGKYTVHGHMKAAQ